MKNGEVLNLYETLERLSKNYELKFNVRVGYIMARNKEKLRQEAIIIYDQRRKIIMEHGTLDKDNNIIVDKQYIDETNQKINELMEIENPIKIDLVPPDEFENNMMNLTDIEGLIPMIMPFMFTGPAIYRDEKTPE